MAHKGNPFITSNSDLGLPIGFGIAGADYVTGTVDFQATPGVIGTFNAPQAAMQFVPVMIVVESITRDNVVVVAPAFRIQQNSVDLTSSSFGPAAATINARAAAATMFVVINMDKADMTTFPLQLNLVTAATGPTSFTGRIHIFGCYTPL